MSDEKIGGTYFCPHCKAEQHSADIHICPNELRGMKPEDQRFAIAKAAPNVVRRRETTGFPNFIVWEWRPDENHAWRQCYLNDPLLDLNAAIQLCDVLKDWEFAADRFDNGMWVAAFTSKGKHFRSEACDSLSSAISEAFLKVRNLWKE